MDPLSQSSDAPPPPPVPPVSTSPVPTSSTRALDVPPALPVAVVEPARPSAKPASAPTLPMQPEWIALLPLLVVMALALGLLASWALHAHRGRSQMLSRLQEVAKDAAIIEARSDELGRFLLDPQTRLVHLRGTQGAAGRAATVAWNAIKGEGMVLVENPGQRQLRLLVQQERQPPMQLLQFSPSSSGGHAFRFPGPLQPGMVTFVIESVAAADSAPAERYEQIDL